MMKTPIGNFKSKKSRPKAKLGIPDLEHSKAAVLRSLGSPNSRRGYQHAIDEFVAWYCAAPLASGCRLRGTNRTKKATWVFRRFDAVCLCKQGAALDADFKITKLKALRANWPLEPTAQNIDAFF